MLSKSGSLLCHPTDLSDRRFPTSVFHFADRYTSPLSYSLNLNNLYNVRSKEPKQIDLIFSAFFHNLNAIVYLLNSKKDAQLN